MFEQIKYLVLDVDGTMTDAGIYYDNTGNEIKKFCTRDGIGFMAARRAGIKLIVLTGRESLATTRRMQEMKIDYLYQKVGNKKEFLAGLMAEMNIAKESLGYIGDDINDYSAMSLAAFVGCPKDSCEQVKSIASYISDVCGGAGVVRDVVEYLLKQRGEWDSVICDMYGAYGAGI